MTLKKHVLIFILAMLLAFTWLMMLTGTFLLLFRPEEDYLVTDNLWWLTLYIPIIAGTYFSLSWINRHQGQKTATRQIHML